MSTKKVSAVLHNPEGLAKDAFISKTGDGSSVPVACKRAIDNLFADARLKGKRIRHFQIKFAVEDPGVAAD